jgi:gluconokinase
MGVQGSGKSTIGRLLADRLDLRFIDGDGLHSAESIAVMAAGNALTDEQRIPWLQKIGQVLAAESAAGIVVACSALKRGYRDLLRESVMDLFVVYPEGTIELVAARIGERQHEFMPTGLLQSQFDTLEPLQEEESGITVDIRLTPAKLIESIAHALEAHAATGEESRVN